MNQIRAIQALNKREIENGVPPEASWHVDYRDTAFVYFGGLPYELSEGDVIAIFSQFGEPVFLKLARDKETGRSKGFGWLKYEDQRSTDLAVDNLGGAEIAGRLVRVDHARYKLRDDEDPEEYLVGWEHMMRRERAEKGLPSDDGGDETDEEGRGKQTQARPMLKEERELQLLIENHDDDDPMKEFLIDEKKKEIEEALRKETRRSDRDSRKHRDKDRHRHRSHRSRRDESGDEGRDRDKYRSRDGDRERERDRDADRKPRSRRDEPPTESRRDEEDKSRRRHRDSPARDRSRDGRGDRNRDRERRDDRRRGDDEGRRDSQRRRDASRDRGERRHRDRERSRTRSPRPHRG